MRILKFTVINNRIIRDPNSNFENITTDDELIAVFDFSQDWNGAVKVAAFFNSDGECPPQYLTDGIYCVIPKEVTNGYWFRIQVIGNKHGEHLSTNKLDIIQNGGKR